MTFTSPNFDLLYASIRQYGRFNEDDRALLGAKVQMKEIFAGDYMLSHGQVCNEIYFILRGSMKLAYSDADQDRTTILNLFAPGDWALDKTSFVSQIPAKSQLQVCTDGLVFTLHIHDLHELVALSQTFLTLGKILYSSKHSVVELNPLQRYQYLLDTHPDYFQCFSLKDIASFLQMTPETLSRVRKKLKAK